MGDKNCMQKVSQSPLTTTIRVGVESYLRSMFTCIPGFVVDFDEPTQTATLQIAIQKINKDGEFEDHPEIIDCQVGFAGSDVVVGHKILPNTEGLILFSQRGIDNWRDSGGICQPSTRRKFDITDAFFLPFFRSDPNLIQGFKNDGAWMATKDGQYFFHLKSDGSIDVNVKETTWKTEKFTIDSSEVEMTGNLKVAKNVEAENVKASSSSSAGSVKLESHVHSGVRGGPDNTGGPI